MEMLRNRTKEIRIGNVWIGGSHPVAIQSMTNTKTEDVAATVEQILALEAAGCEITGLPLLPLKTGQIRSVSIRATSVPKSVCRQ